MKKALLLFSIFIISLAGFSQSDLVLNFCNNTPTKENKITLSIAQLTECSDLIPNNKDLTVVSFSVAMMAGNDALEIEVKGNKLTQKVIATIKRINPSKFYVEKIKLSSEKGTTQFIGAHTVIIKK